MADIEVVIKIREEKYDVIKSDLYNTFPAEMKAWGLEAIRNGTPLPEHHGRLIDADVLNNNVHYVPLAPIFQGDYVTYRYVIFADILGMLPTIIEGSDNNDE